MFWDASGPYPAKLDPSTPYPPPPPRVVFFTWQVTSLSVPVSTSVLMAEAIFIVGALDFDRESPVRGWTTARPLQRLSLPRCINGYQRNKCWRITLQWLIFLSSDRVLGRCGCATFLGDGSLFIGMTGSGKKWPGPKKVLSGKDGLRVFSAKMTGSEKKNTVVKKAMCHANMAHYNTIHWIQNVPNSF